MKTCPMCEGKKVTGRFVGGDGDQFVPALGRRVKMAAIVDQPCGVCGGTGRVSDDHHARLTDPAAARNG